MAQLVDGPVATFTAGEALAAFRRVKLSTTADTVVYADAGDDSIGVTEEAAASGADVAVKLNSAEGTRKMTASAAIALHAKVYGTDDGKIDDTGIGALAGVALEAATASGDIIKVFPLSTEEFGFPLYEDSAAILSGGSDQGTRADSATQNYPLGMKRTYHDGRVFRYVKARTALHTEFGACYAAKTIAAAVAPVQASGAGAIGDVKVTITVANTDGLAGDGAVAANELVGGYVVIGNGTSQHPMNRRIIANTVAASNKSTLTLDEALDQTVTASTTVIETLMNPWILSDGNVTNSGYVTFRGLPACELTIDHFGFVQTAGPCWITSDSNTCNSDGDRQIYFANNGSCVSGNDVTGDVNVQQLAGHAMDMSSSGASNAPFVNLCLEVS